MTSFEAVKVGSTGNGITVTPHPSVDPPWVCLCTREGDATASLVLEVHKCEQLVRAIQDACVKLSSDDARAMREAAAGS